MSNLKTCQDPPNQGQGIWPYFQKNQNNYFVENKMIKHIFFYLSNFKILHFFDEIFMADHTLFEFFVHGFAFGEFLLQVNNLVFQTFIPSDPKLGIPFGNYWGKTINQDMFCSLYTYMVCRFKRCMHNFLSVSELYLAGSNLKTYNLL